MESTSGKAASPARDILVSTQTTPVLGCFGYISLYISLYIYHYIFLDVSGSGALISTSGALIGRSQLNVSMAAAVCVRTRIHMSQNVQQILLRRKPAKPSSA